MKLIPKSPFTWLLLFFLAYAYLTAYGPSNKNDQDKKAPPVKPSKDVEISVKSDKGETSFLDKPINSILNKLKKTETGEAVVNAIIAQAVNKKYGKQNLSVSLAQEKGEILTVDKLIGTGKGSSFCNSIATLHYETFTKGMVKFDSTIDNNSPITFTIGEHQVIKGLERGVLGMKKGGKRQIAIPSYLAYDDTRFQNDLIYKGQPVLLEVELLDLKNPIEQNATMIIQNNTIGTSKAQAFCSDKVNISYKFLDDDKVKNKGKLEFTIGNKNLPLGLEKGIIGMKTGSVRKITIPPQLLVIHGKNILPKELLLPKNQNATFEIELLKIN